MFDPEFVRTVTAFLILGSVMIFAMIVLFTIDRKDRRHKKSYKH